MNQRLEEQIKTYIKMREERCLSEFASKSEDGLRKLAEPDDIRSRYSRDCDRIIHTHAYSRYIDKTQVFFAVDNDHITHRVLHVQLVSKIARTIGRALKLNEDLIEAISLGHDIGHVPFGHIGEDVLSELCKKNNIGCFAHNAQSVQFLDVIEDRNLTLQVLDGILCHNGEQPKQELVPNDGKDWDDFDKEFNAITTKNINDCVPMTLEGCVVRFSDIIAYLGRDIQDAIEIGLIESVDIPTDCKELIGISDLDNKEEMNRTIINKLIIDLIEHSYGCNYISYSRDISDCVKDLLDFNNKSIYRNKKLLADKDRIEIMYDTHYNFFLDALENKRHESRIYRDFVDLSKNNPQGWIDDKYLDKSNNAEKVRDYIAGMTDRYFEMVLKEIIFPKKVRTYKETH